LSLENQSEPTDFYWATDETESLVDYVCSRRDKYFQNFYGSSFFGRIDRNWRYWNGIFYEGVAPTEGDPDLGEGGRERPPRGQSLSLHHPPPHHLHGPEPARMDTKARTPTPGA